MPENTFTASDGTQYTSQEAVLRHEYRLAYTRYKLALDTAQSLTEVNTHCGDHMDNNRWSPSELREHARVLNMDAGQYLERANAEHTRAERADAERAKIEAEIAERAKRDKLTGIRAGVVRFALRDVGSHAAASSCDDDAAARVYDTIVAVHNTLAQS